MRSVGTRFLLPVGMLTALFAAFVVYRAYMESQRHTDRLIREQAALAMKFNLAIRDYAGEKIRPAMERLLDRDQFDPETMSTSFISRSIFDKVRKDFPDYLVRFASDQPRNPVNAATADELRMIDFFRKNPEVKERVERLTIEGRPYLVYFTPKWMKQECLRCHGDPKDAPAELLARYGAAASFHRKAGDVAGLDTVAIPLDTLRAGIAEDFWEQLLFFIAGIVVLFGALIALFRFVVTGRLEDMASHFRTIAEHPDSGSLTPLAVRGNDEIAVAGDAFNRLVEHLRVAHTSLEAKVEARTAELTRMNEELQRENEERRRAEAVLAETEARYRLIAENASDVIWLFDLAQNRFTYVSPSVEHLRGFTPEEVVQQSLQEALEEESFRLVTENLPHRITALEAGDENARVVTVEVDQKGKDGRVVPTEAATTLVTDGTGKVTQLLGVTRSIHERKQAEKALRESEERFRTIFEKGQVGIVRVANDGAFLQANPAFCAILGYGAAEILSLNVDTVTHPEDRAQSREEMLALFQHRRSHVHLDIRYLRKDGGVVWAHTTAAWIFDSEARPLYGVAMIQDITERKRAEVAVRASEEKYRRLHETLMDAFVIVEMDGRIREFNHVYQDMLGYSEDELYTLTYRDLTPEKWHAVEEEIVREQVLRWGHSEVYEKEYLRKDGSVFPVELRTVLSRDASGKPAAMWAIIRDISERKRVAAALAESEWRFRSLFESMTEGVALHELVYAASGEPVDYRVIDVNPAFERHVGIPAAQARNRLASELYGSGQPPFLDQYKVVATERVGLSFEVSFPSLGRDFHISAFSPSRNWFATVFEDITERKRAEAELQRSAQEIEDLYSNAPCGYHSLDRNGVFSRVNDTELRWLQYRRDELINKREFPDLITADSREAFGKSLPLLEAAGTVSDLELEMVRKDGTTLPVLLSAIAVFDAEGRPVGSRATVFDMTERKRAEEERNRLEAQIQQAQKLESLGVLAGGIAHDFNNLLMAIIGNADLALQDISDVSPARPMLEEIDKTAHRAAELCKQMLAYSGKGHFIIKPINLSELVREMSHMLSISISKKAVLRQHLADNLPSVEADATQIRQVIMNLIINASEAIGDRSGVISVATDLVVCDEQYLQSRPCREPFQGGRCVCLEVKDTGCGMAPNIQERIFDPFFTTKFTGRGLGLAAVLGIVRGHNGTIDVSSEPGKGTTFRVFLPALDEPAQSIHELTPMTTRWQGAGTVLLVDDEDNIRSLGRRMLERLGFDVLTAGNGLEALKIFRTHEAPIRCVLLDLTMPHMDGEETFLELQRINPDVCVIMSSGYDELEIVNRFDGKGLAGFIQKPYRSANLTAVLRRVLGD